VKYVALDDINQLWDCYLTNKIDPSVFDEPCLGPCRAASQKTANSYFTHVTNYIVGGHANATKKHRFLEPSSFLNVEVTDDQRYLLQPTASDVLVGNILEDLIGLIIQVQIKMVRQTLLHGLSRTSAS
jgi:hypothetical protein